MTMVFLNSLFSVCSRFRISSALFASRSPVGSSATSTAGSVDDGARDRDALLLSAGELPRVVLRIDRRDPTTFSAVSARSRRCFFDRRVSSSGSSTFSSAVSTGNQVVELEDEPDAPAAPLRQRALRQRRRRRCRRQRPCRWSDDRCPRSDSAASSCPTPTAPSARRTRPRALRGSARRGRRSPGCRACRPCARCWTSTAAITAPLFTFTAVPSASVSGGRTTSVSEPTSPSVTISRSRRVPPVVTGRSCALPVHHLEHLLPTVARDHGRLRDENHRLCRGSLRRRSARQARPRGR